MPTYEYRCQDCSKTFEYFQSMTEEPKSVCPECSGSLKRMISGGTGVIFKGNGFYVNDSKGAKTAAGASQKKNETPSACASCPAASDSTSCGAGK